MEEMNQMMTLMIMQEGCSTPTREECRIPGVAACCPPPPKKKKKAFSFGKKREPPKNGYFQSPDELEAFFNIIGPRREQACG
ncbi:hypothetical protein EZV62_002686 [Acer yangbiense]|uniref:Cyclin-dependent protein kinase inhibitor SMR4 n=1 Tax=Acer yangbiense TaxID=1000413 RepID=A0A5C7IXT6_9ROSI|nr:hypothetical protein EZV62_002686 [Acer yangbiense]